MAGDGSIGGNGGQSGERGPRAAPGGSIGGGGSTRLASMATWAFLAFAVFVSAVSDLKLLREYPLHVDVEIPLRAAERWLAGESPYNPGAFDPSTTGADLPFLYPPYFLPFLAILSQLPRLAIQLPWMAANIALGYWAGRRLGLPRPVAAAILLWPPFLEAILGGNVGLLLFAAFAGLLWRGGQAIDLRASGRPAVIDGGLATLPAVFKLSLIQPWLFLLRRRWRAAVVGAAIPAAVAVATLPIVGIDAWWAWRDQIALAAEPMSSAAGMAASAVFALAFGPAIGVVVGVVLTAASLVLALAIRGRLAGEWLGILMVVGASSIHIYGFLFLLPSMLVVRRDLALVAAAMIATYNGYLAWAAVGLVAVGLVLARRAGEAPGPADGQPRPGVAS